MGIFNRIEKRITGFVDELATQKRMMEMLRDLYPDNSFAYEKITLHIELVGLKIAIWEDVKWLVQLWTK